MFRSVSFSVLTEQRPGTMEQNGRCSAPWNPERQNGRAKNGAVPRPMLGFGRALHGGVGSVPMGNGAWQEGRELARNELDSEIAPPSLHKRIRGFYSDIHCLRCPVPEAESSNKLRTKAESVSSFRAEPKRRPQAKRLLRRVSE